VLITHTPPFGVRDHGARPRNTPDRRLEHAFDWNFLKSGLKVTVGNASYYGPMPEYIEKHPEVCGGKACVIGRRIRVQDVAYHSAWCGWSADQIAEEFDLSLSQVLRLISNDTKFLLSSSTTAGSERATALVRRAPGQALQSLYFSRLRSFLAAKTAIWLRFRAITLSAS
jgi:uncharacterized protein (DUF433 family)